MNPLLLRGVLGLLCLAGLVLTGPWPGLQAIFHALLVLGLAPFFRGSLAVAAWALAAGWLVEGTQGVLPHMGGTPLADLCVALGAWALLRRLPPPSRWALLPRLAALLLAQLLLVHFAVRLAGGPHVWGWAWLWTLLALPLWGSLAAWAGGLPGRR